MADAKLALIARLANTLLDVADHHGLTAAAWDAYKTASRTLTAEGWTYDPGSYWRKPPASRMLADGAELIREGL